MSRGVPLHAAQDRLRARLDRVRVGRAAPPLDQPAGPTAEDCASQAQIAADEAHRASSTAACCATSARRARTWPTSCSRCGWGSTRSPRSTCRWRAGSTWSDSVLHGPCRLVPPARHGRLQLRPARARNDHHGRRGEIPCLVRRRRASRTSCATRATRTCARRARPRRSRRSTSGTPHSLDTFGGAKSRFSELAVSLGIRRWGNEELRQMWRKDIDPQIEKLGLKVPDAEKGRLIR